MKKTLNILMLMLLKIISFFIRKENVVIIGTYSRYRYGGNTKYLYEYLSENRSLDVYWLTESKDIIDFLESKKLKYLSNKNIIQKIKMTLKCKVVIDSGTGHYNPFNYFSSDKKVLKISTMHGSGPKLTVERKKNINDTLDLIKKINSFNCVSFCTEHSRRIIGINQLLLSHDKTKLFGLPKHDLLGNENYVNSIYDKRKWSRQIIGEDVDITNAKIIYYTPTFRTTCESLPINVLSGFSADEFEDFLNEENIYFIYSFHNLNNFTDNLINSERIRFVSTNEYPLFDNFELMLESDMMIGDYSTLATDFSLLYKPQLFIMPDYNEIYKTKGFAEDLRGILPGKEIATFQELKKSVKKYITDERLFLKDFESNIKDLHTKYVSPKKMKSRQQYHDYILNFLND